MLYQTLYSGFANGFQEIIWLSQLTDVDETNNQILSNHKRGLTCAFSGGESSIQVQVITSITPQYF